MFHPKCTHRQSENRPNALGKNISFPTKPIKWTDEDLMTMIMDHFSPTKFVAVDRDRFNSMVQLPSKIVLKFFPKN